MHNSQYNPLVSEYPSGPDASLFKGILLRYPSKQAYSQDQFWGVQDPKKVDLWTKKVNFLNLTIYLYKKTQFLAHFVAKKWTFPRQI